MADLGPVADCPVPARALAKADLRLTTRLRNRGHQTIMEAMRKLITIILSIVVAGCATPSIAPTNSDFSPPDIVEITRGFELRDRYNIPKYIGHTAIFVDSVAVHHSRNEASTIVWRDEAGNWQRSQVVERGPGGLLNAERKLVANKTRSLADAEAVALERLIREPELYHGEVLRSDKIGVGAPRHVMAIITPFGRTTVKWNGRLLGIKGEIADIVLGSD